MNKYPLETIPSTVRYLNEVIDELPHNCMYDKFVTGAGGTTIALQNNSNYVICVPYISLIENKVHFSEGVLGVYKKTTDFAIKKYLNDIRIPVKKIMVTYDSLPRVVQAINPSEYKLLVDEVHSLFQAYSYRKKAVHSVLEHYEKFKSYCFMTATLIEPEFNLKELQHLPIYVADWEETRDVTVNSIKCELNVIHTVAYLVDEFLSGGEVGNAHIFVNSIDFIKSLIKACGLNDSNTRAIWSDNNLKKVDLNRGKTTDPLKKINIYTSTCFEGCDLFDPDGKIFIISDGEKAHSIIDIATQFKQISGRIRNTKYWDTIWHIYSSTRYDINVSYEEYKQLAEKEVKSCNQKIDELNTLSIESRELVLPSFRKSCDLGLTSYVSTEGDYFAFDENLVKLDLYNYKVTKTIYKLRINVEKEFKDNGYQVNVFYNGENEKNYTRVKVINPKDNFKDTVLELKTSKDSDFAFWAYKEYPFLHDAITLLGYDKIEELKYQTTNIKRHLNNIKYTQEPDKIKAELLLHYKITPGVFVPSSELKEILQQVYLNLDINKIAKARDMEKYIKLVPSKKRYGVETKNGFNILSIN